MRDFYPTSVVFTPGGSGVGTIVLSSIPNFDIRDLGIINNLTKNAQIYAAGIDGYGYTALAGVNNSTITLQYDTSTHSASDVIQVMYSVDQNARLYDANGNAIVLGRKNNLSSVSVTLAADISAVPVSNGDIIISESFNTIDTLSTWALTSTGGDIITVDGNAIGNNYLVFSLDPLANGTTSQIETKGRFAYPSRIMFGASRNTTAVGKEFSYEFVTDELIDSYAPVAIAQMWQNANTALMLSTYAPHGLKVGQSITLDGLLSGGICYSSLVVAATPSVNLLSCTGGVLATTLPTNITFSNLSTGGFIYRRSRMGGAANGVSMIWESSSNVTASFYNRSGAGDSGDTFPGCANANFVNTHTSSIGSQSSVVPFTLPNVYSFLPTNQYELITQSDYVEWFDRVIDASNAIPIVRLKRDQMTPDPTKLYKFRFRGTNNRALTKPDVRVLSANRIASNTWILSTDGPHNCTPLQDQVFFYGSSDPVNFPNVTTAVTVCAAPGPNVLTFVTGTVGTFQSVGGYVGKQKSSSAMSVYGAVTQQISSVSRTSNVLSLSSGAGTWSGPVIGEYVNVIGCISAGAVYGESLNIDGPYRVQNLTTNLLVLEPITAYNSAGSVYVASPTGVDFGATNCGGAIVRRNEIRVNYVRGYRYNRNIVESHGGFMRNDVAASLPVYITGTTPTLSANISFIGGTALVTGGLAGTLGVGGNVAVGSFANLNTLNPLIGGIEDVSGIARRFTGDSGGGLAGPGELLNTFILSGGNFTPIEGTHCKTIYVPPKDSQVLVGIKSVGLTPGFQLEGSYDNRIFSCIPLTRFDSVTAGAQYVNVSSFLPIVGATYKGNTYGYPILRLHSTTFTGGAQLSGIIRVIPNYEIAGQTIVPWTLSSVGGTGQIIESVGSTTGNVMLGTVKTIPITVQGSAKAQLIIDSAVGFHQLALEGSSDYGASFQLLSVTPLSGGTTLLPYMSVNAVSLLNPVMGVYEANVSNLTHARVRLTQWVAGSASGALKITNIPSNAGLGNSDKASYTASVFNQSYTTANTLVSAITIESGAYKTTRIKRLMVQPGFATATTTATLCVFRYTAANMTGTSVNAASMQKETTDPAFTGLVKTNITNVNLSNQTLTQFVFQIPVPATTLSMPQPLIFDFTNGGTEKGITITNGTTNGVLFGYSGSGAGATGFGMSVDFTEE